MKVKNVFLYGGLEKEQIDHIKEDITNQNFHTIRGLMHIEMVYTLIIILFHRHMMFFNQDFIFPYIIAFLVYLILFLLSEQFRDTFEHSVFYTYICVIIINIDGIILALMHPTLPAIGLAVVYTTLPLLLTDRPIRLYTTMYLCALIYIVLLLTGNNSQTGFTDFWNIITYTLMVTPISMMVQLRRFRFLYHRYEMSEMEKKDIMTDVYNRNYYEQICHELDPFTSVIFIDANGLHELNNSKGHKQGDKMLITIAQRLKQTFGDTSTFRIGGDEFVCFSKESKEKILENMTQINHDLKLHNYYISYGVGCDKNIKVAIQTAEHHMYDQKKQFYAQSGHNRRKESI